MLALDLLPRSFHNDEKPTSTRQVIGGGCGWFIVIVATCENILIQLEIFSKGSARPIVLKHMRKASSELRFEKRFLVIDRFPAGLQQTMYTWFTVRVRPYYDDEKKRGSGLQECHDSFMHYTLEESYKPRTRNRMRTKKLGRLTLPINMKWHTNMAFMVLLLDSDASVKTGTHIYSIEQVQIAVDGVSLLSH
ncbi:hypothetical protein C8Q75DRAFT_733219 [Abortiporus biennis]|nr:hypothetical protein C8Q75DRAFT_733219 [Abortiporus biennis]